MDRCEIPRCRAGADITYLGHGVCEDHWNDLSSETAAPDALRVALGLPGGEVTEVQDMENVKKAAKGEAATDAPVKATKTAKAKKQTVAKQAKPVREPKAKREQVENPVVFAFRLSEADRKRIHDAAGGGKASQFVLAAALAAASGDLDAFKRVTETRATK